MGGCLVGVGCCAWEADGGKLLLELGLGVMRLMVVWVGLEVWVEQKKFLRARRRCARIYRQFFERQDDAIY